MIVHGWFNVLDYSAYTKLVSVNLRYHTATGVGKSVFNIQEIIGGSGGSNLASGPVGAVLIGGSGHNFLFGDSGRDVLIAGPGTSVIQAGTGEAIMIGGTTIFDANVAALSAILAEWRHTYLLNPKLDYYLRIAHLEHGGGLNGPYLLTPTTVHSNGANNVLTTGLEYDFVFFDALDTLTHPQRPGEVFVKL
jgi:Ca2+-binding RTX toxin-like protein